MTYILRRFAALILGGMFALSAVSFSDFLVCSTNDGARIEERDDTKRRRLPR